MPDKPQRWYSLPKGVWILGGVSLLNDTATESVYPLLPFFLTTVLGATPVSLGLIEGAGGVDQFSDRAVRDGSIVSVRDRVTTVIDSSLHEDQVRILVTAKNGERFEKFVEHAVGSLEHPMSDNDLETKFTGLANGVLPSDRQRKLMDLCWHLEGLKEAGTIAHEGRST